MNTFTAAFGIEAFIAAFNLGLRDQHLLETQSGGAITARYFNCSLSSVFQPIVAAQDGGVISHQGLLRCFGGGIDAPTSPWGVFSLAGQDRDLVDLDRLCRTLHTLNYFRQNREGLSLFLNINLRLLTVVRQGFGQDFEQRLKGVGLRPRSIVIELPDGARSHADLVHRATVDYQERGYRVAVRQEKTTEGLSTYLRKVRPDIVRISASAGNGERLKAETANAIHNIGALALADKVETAAQEEQARNAGFDLIQGFRVGDAEGAAQQVLSSQSLTNLFARRSGAINHGASASWRFGENVRIASASVVPKTSKPDLK